MFVRAVTPLYIYKYKVNANLDKYKSKRIAKLLLWKQIKSFPLIECFLRIDLITIFN